MEIIPANDAQIDEFLKGAADRYAEQGIDPGKAQELFMTQLKKIAAELNLQPVEMPSPKQMANNLLAYCKEAGIKIKRK